MRSARPAIVWWVLLGAVAAFGAVRLATAWQEGISGGHDFVQDYTSVQAIAEGRNPYEPYNDMTQRLFGGPPHKGKLYSFHAPSSLIFFMPLTPLPYGAAFVAWGLVSLAGLWLVCALSLSVVGLDRPWLAGLVTALALIALLPIRENFVEGQLNVVVAAGIVATWMAQRSARPWLAGACLGAAFALKPIPGLFFLYYLYRREWRLLGAAAVVLIVLNLVGLGLAGWDGLRLYATVNYPDHAAVWPAYPDNASLHGFFTRLFGPSSWKRPPYPLPGASTALWLLSGAALAAVAWVAVRRGRNPSVRDADARGSITSGDLDVAALCAFTLLVTPIVWPHYYVVLIPTFVVAGAWLWHARDRAPGRARTGLAVLVIAGAVLATAHYEEPYRGAGGQQLCALLAVYAVSLATLWWSGEVQRTGTSPESRKYPASARAPTA
jgi:alpha-1,2-mannosyltransferase